MPPLNLDAIAKSVVAASREEPPAPPLEGFSSFEYIGGGGLGHVWKAWWKERSRWVAVKMPRAPSVETNERFVQEGRLLACLEHPHIVQVLAVRETNDGTPILVMEFVEGANLADLLPADGFPVDQATDLLQPVLAAVTAAHQAGVIHRDLKPANVLLSTEGVVKVADFGLAASVEHRQVQLSLTHSGMVAGSLEYLPPESFARGAASTVAGDVYALGVLLYELLAGSPPRGAWRPVSELRPVDIRFDALIASAMHPDPGQRLASAAEFTRRLNEIRQSPPRHRGTPLVTLPVRTMDFLWSGLGAFAALLAVSTSFHLDKSATLLPLNLFGSHSPYICGWLALKTLALTLAAMMLWQLARLWRFRKVPWTEALPLPFGLRLGTGKTAAVLTLLAQFLLVAMPAFLAWGFWSELPWRRPAFPGLEHVLWITDSADAPVAAWDWHSLADGTTVWLKETTFDSRGKIMKPHDKVEFRPGLEPAVVAISGALVALATAGAFLMRAAARFRPQARALPWAVGAGLTACLGAGFVLRTHEFDRRQRTWNLDEGPDARRLVEEREVGYFFDRFLLAREYGREDELLGFYTPDVHAGPPFNNNRPREDQVRAILGQRSRTAARKSWDRMGHGVAPQGEDVSTGIWTCFVVRQAFLEFDGGPSGPSRSLSGFEQVEIMCRRDESGEWKIFKESGDYEPLYDVAPRDLNRDDAVAWLKEFLACLSTAGSPDLERFFLAGGPGRHRQHVSETVPELRSERALHPGAAMSLETLEGPFLLAGSRQRLHVHVRHQPAPKGGSTKAHTRYWKMDLVHQGDRWRIVSIDL